LEKQIAALAEAVGARLVEIRRDLHPYPDVGFTEMRTASKVARRLQEPGY